jgi:hypothetical protein
MTYNFGYSVGRNSIVVRLFGRPKMSDLIFWKDKRGTKLKLVNALRLPLPAPAEQTQAAEAGSEERQCGGKWSCGGQRRLCNET